MTPLDPQQDIEGEQDDSKSPQLGEQPEQVKSVSDVCLYRKFVDWFESKAQRPIKLTGRVYDASKHNGWGDNIYWSHYDTRQVGGFLWNKPVVGDEIRFEMKSGKVARYAVLEVKTFSDPRDMFFADVMDIGYVGEPPINKIVEAPEHKNAESESNPFNSRYSIW